MDDASQWHHGYSHLGQGGSGALPDRFALGQNVPNPAFAATTIRFALPTPAHVKLEIFDLLGRRLTTLTNGNWVAGYHALSWDGRDARGTRAGPGIYLCRMSAGAFHASRKMVVML